MTHWCSSFGPGAHISKSAKVSRSCTSIAAKAAYQIVMKKEQDIIMSYPKIVSRDEWLAARAELLTKEKEATRARDRLNAERRRLPMVKMDKEYVFEGPNG